jgi:nitrogen-specific signal transduction histidine kinase
MGQVKVNEAAKILGSEIESALDTLKGENQLLHKQANNYPQESFTNISGVFARLAQVSGELNISYFNQFFQNISDVAHYCTEVENPRVPIRK